MNLVSNLVSFGYWLGILLLLHISYKSFSFYTLFQLTFVSIPSDRSFHVCVYYRKSDV